MTTPPTSDVIADLVTRSRISQGLPTVVTDPAALDQIARTIVTTRDTPTDAR